MSATAKDVMTSRVAAVTAADLMTTPPVTITPGRPETVRQGRDILAEAWRVEGVVSVRDRLTYPDV
jgi:hypothetical protein